MTAELDYVKQLVEDRARCKTDKLFLALSLGYDFQPEVHAELFDVYIKFNPNRSWVEQSDKKNRLILWPRGHYKTTSVVVEIIQAILNFPDIRMLIMQGSQKTTQRLMSEIQSHFLGTAAGSRLKELFPEFCGETRHHLQADVNRFTVPCRKRKQIPQATVSVAAPRVIKTGQHYDAMFADDLVNDQNYRNQRLLDKVRQDFYMCIPLIDPGGYFYVSGTRYAHGDLYEVILRQDVDKNNWIKTVKTCWTDDGKDVRFPQRKARDGRTIGFTRELLESIRQVDPGMFSSQYLNRPVSEGSRLFDKQMMTDCLVVPLSAPSLSDGVLFVDLAATDNATSDDSVVLCGKVDHLGKMYVTDVVGGQWTPAQLATMVCHMSLKHRPLRVYIEKTASCLYFVEYLRMFARDKGMSLPIDFIKVNNQANAKAIRISALQGFMKNGRIKFFAGMEQWDRMVEQFTAFSPNASGHAHDDYPDTVALMAIQFGGQIMSITPLSESRRHPLIAAIEDQNIVTETQNSLKNRGADELGSDFSF